MSLKPTLETLSNAWGSPPFSPFPPRDADRNNRRILLFLAILALSLAASLAYVWMRAPIYESKASLLTVSPEAAENPQERSTVSVHRLRTEGKGMLPSINLTTELEASREAGNSEHVIMQQQILLGVPVLEATLRRLQDQDEAAELRRLNLGDLGRMLSVEVVPQTNLVELKAQGSQPKLLAPVVNAWIDAYQSLREQSTRESASRNYEFLGDEYRQLDKKIEEKREALEQFRAANDIQAQTDSEGTPMVRLKGLNDALNKAIDEAAKAKAKLKAVQAAIARGEPIMPDEEAAGLENLEKRAQELRETEKDLLSRYTSAYVQMNPQHRQVAEKLAQVESLIREKTETGKRSMLSQAEQAQASTEQTVEELQRKVEEAKRESSEFSKRFAQQETMRADLDRLEEMRRDLQEKLARIESNPDNGYPPLQVVGRAYPPLAPAFPRYWRDSGIALAGSLSLALAFVWLFDYLTRGEKAAPAYPTPSFQIYQIPGYLAPNYPTAEPSLPLRQAPALLAQDSAFPRELSDQDAAALLQAADDAGRLWIGLLLSGLSVEEAGGLRYEDLDLEGDRIRVVGQHPRSAPLAPLLKTILIERQQGIGSEHTLEKAKVASKIVGAALDSGLSEPETIDADAIRHTYIAHLVRQGIRLSDLERIVGPLPPKDLLAYGRLSPPGQKLNLDQVSLIHAALRGDETTGGFTG